VRQLSLYNTPQEHGGCKGCQYFVVCTGYCPGTGIEFEEGREGDWRLRSTHCDVLKEQFADMERKLRGVGEIPITQQPYLKRIEQAMIATWASGNYISLDRAVEIAKDGTKDPTDLGWLGSRPDARGHGDSHGDHVNVANLKKDRNRSHGNHIDSPHGDSHGDHVNVAKLQKNNDIQPHGDSHGDHVNVAKLQKNNDIQPHGDEHGDHVDTTIPRIDHGDLHADHIDAQHNDNNSHLYSTEYRPYGDHVDSLGTSPHGDSHDNLHGDHTNIATLYRPVDTGHGDHVDSLGTPPHGDSHDNLHGDHTNVANRHQPLDTGHGDHVDSLGTPPHGDSHDNLHGDHTDLSLLKG